MLNDSSNHSTHSTHSQLSLPLPPGGVVNDGGRARLNAEHTNNNSSSNSNNSYHHDNTQQASLPPPPSAAAAAGLDKRLLNRKLSFLTSSQAREIEENGNLNSSTCSSASFSFMSGL
jgi:hypothetical protein